MTEEEREPLDELTQADIDYLSAAGEPFMRVVQRFTDSVMPAARRIDIVGNLEKLHPFDHDLEAMLGPPKRRAIEMVRRAFLFVVASRRLFDEPELVPPATKQLGTWEAGLQVAVAQMDQAVGYMTAIADIEGPRKKGGLKGAAIQRSYGERERLRLDAALRKLSPEDRKSKTAAAAALVEANFGGKYTTLYRKLTTTYSEDEWAVLDAAPFALKKSD